MTAEKLAEAINSLFTDEVLVYTYCDPEHRIRVRPGTEFKEAYVVGETNHVAIHDSNGVMTGAQVKQFTIDADRRTVYVVTTNAFGERLSFAWTIQRNDGGELWHKFNEVAA